MNGLRSELYRLARRPMPWVLLGLIALLIIALYGLLFASIGAQEQAANAQPGGSGQQGVESLKRILTLRAVPEFTAGLAQAIAVVLGVILVSSSIGTEYAWGTLRTMIPRTGRRRFIGAKLLSLAGFAFLLTLVAFLAGILGALAVSALGGFDRSVDPDFLARLAGAIGRTWFVELPFLAMAFGIAIWTRSSAAGIAATLIVFFVEGAVTSILAGLGPSYAGIGNGLLGRNVTSIARLNAAPGAPVSPQAAAGAAQLLDPGLAALILAAYTVLFVGIAVWRFLRKDIAATS